MSEMMTPSEIVEGLVRQGVPREKAEQAVFIPNRGKLGKPAINAEPVPTVSLPFTLTIPWSELCSDNERDIPYCIRLKSGEVVARIKKSERYKAARSAIKERARGVAAGRLPIAGIALAIHANVYVPSGSSRNDAINFEKCTHDALEDVVYANDNQLEDVHWKRAGVDIDAPRCELTISYLPRR